MYTLRTIFALLQKPTPLLHHLLTKRSFQGAVEHSILEHYKTRSLCWRNLKGYKILLDCRRHAFAPWIATTGAYELETSLVFSLLAKREGTILDIGAGIGWYTLLGAMMSNCTGTIYAVEPDPASVVLICESVRANNLSNIKVIEACVSNGDGETNLNLASDPGYNSMKRTGDKGRLRSACFTIDSFVRKENLKLIDLIKIDVEGAEPEVLQGALQTLEEGKIFDIILEWNPTEWKDHPDLLRYLLDRYRCNKIQATRLLSRVDSRKLLRPMEPDKTNQYHGNILLSLKR